MKNKKDTSLDNYGCDENDTVHPDCPEHAPKSTHTPTQELRDLIQRVNCDADATFIVRAANAHEELLKALKNISWSSDPHLMQEIALKAIAKAEGRQCE